MGTKKGYFNALLSALGLGILILDSKTALAGAAEGIGLCIGTVIPALFPFFVISAMLTSQLMGHTSRLFFPLERLLGIPRGSIPLFLVGLLGGYPVGAHNLCQAYELGQLPKNDARRMLGFCSNAGPAFLFGMCGNLFSSPLIPWMLWGILILSAIAVGCILPGKSSGDIILSQREMSLPQAMNRAVKTMAQVCGWVVLFRVILTFLQRWFFFFLPQDIQVCLAGLLELSNGCISLQGITLEGLRFILCGCFLSFGGVCVAMQTISVTSSLGTGLYFPGKAIQFLICFVLSVVLQRVLFPSEKCIPISPFILAASMILAVFFAVLVRKRENKSSNLETVHV